MSDTADRRTTRVADDVGRKGIGSLLRKGWDGMEAIILVVYEGEKTADPADRWRSAGSVRSAEGATVNPRGTPSAPIMLRAITGRR